MRNVFIVLSMMLVDYLCFSKLRQILFAFRFGHSGKQKAAEKKKRMLQGLSLKEKLTLTPIVLSCKAKEAALRVQRRYLVYLLFAIISDVFVVFALTIGRLQPLRIWTWAIALGIRIVLLCVVRFTYYQRGLKGNPTV